MREEVARLTFESPIGPMEIAGTERGILRVEFLPSCGEDTPNTPECLHECRDQLEGYFTGSLRVFSVPLIPEGTPFQKSVWRELMNIPYGSTASYGRIAEMTGNPGAARAVGQANNRNPVAVVIPCHRVIGHRGDLVGYGSGLWRKEWLLKHEGSL